MKKFICILKLLLLLSTITVAQYQEFTLEKRINGSNLILEGKVISQFTYENDGLIYTANQIEVCDIIYNAIQPSIEMTTDIYVITHGGRHEGKFNNWSHMLKLHVGIEGLFFLRSNTDLIPSDPPTNSSFYLPYGQEQALIHYSKDRKWDFQGRSLFESLTNIDSYIDGINQETGQSNVINSCVVGQKSGIGIRIDTVTTASNQVVVHTSIKGQWSKSYDLNKARIEFDFSSPIDLSQYNIIVSSFNTTISTNYNLTWNQPNSTSAYAEIEKNLSTSNYQEINNQFVDFVQISFDPALLAITDFESFQVTESSYKEGSQVLDFLEFDIVNNKFLKQFSTAPDLTSFVPVDVCAGIKDFQSIGNPLFSGEIIISGNNFDDLDEANLADQIPHNYRVEFRREELNGTNTHKITPLVEDYIQWDDDEIIVRVPTAGWYVTGNNFFEGLEERPAVTGRVTVRNPDGSDDTPSAPNHPEELTIHFAQFNFLDIAGAEESDEIKLIDQSGNGGYLFIFDDSFDGIGLSAGTLQQAKQDVIDAFCDWNMATGVQMEVVDVCPPNTACFPITYNIVPGGGPGMIALAAGIGQPSPFVCPNNVVVAGMELRFNSDIDDWVTSATPNPGQNDDIIRAAAYHEIGHLLQLGHVNNDGATMHPLYGNQIQIDNDAVAGGTHAGNLSFAAPCNNPLIQGAIAGCMNPVYEIFGGQRITISPNPSNSKLQLSFEESITDNTSVYIHDVLGRIIQKYEISYSDSEIDISNLESGNYFLRIEENGQFSNLLKFIKL